MKDLLEYVVGLAKAPRDATIYAVIGAPAEASVEGKATIIEAAAWCTDSVIVCSEPFSVAYGLDFLDDTLVIDIGAGTTDLCRLHGTMPEPDDQRTHEVAGDSIDETLATLIKETYPDAQFSINMIRSFKEKFRRSARPWIPPRSPCRSKVSRKNSTSPNWSTRPATPWCHQRLPACKT